MLNVYTEHATDVIHKTSVDLILRPAGEIVNITQYDDTLPLLKVGLYNNSKEYELPNDIQVYIRYSKPDGTFCYNGALGISEDKKSLYFFISYQMTTMIGKAIAVIEFISGDKKLNSSPIQFTINKNPIQANDIESNVEIGMVQSILDQATQAVTDAQAAAQIAVDAKNYIISVIGGGYVTLDTQQHITGEKTINKININQLITFNQSGKFSGNIVPNVANAYDLGNSVYRLNDIFANNFKGYKLVLGITELDETKLQKLLELLEVFLVEEEES